MFLKSVGVLSLLGIVVGQSQLAIQSSVTVSTVVASPSASLDATLPSQVPVVLQAWCTSKIFCSGSVLQTVNLANLYSDPKTFVDKPTNGTAESVLASFANITFQNTTEEQVLNFVDDNFKGEGLELEALSLSNFTSEPAFLSNISDPLVKAFAQTVHGFWSQLIRGTNSSALCDGVSCESTLIPLNHTFVVPGGRFREQYYWDSFWIVEGLLKSELYDVVNATLQNFMDELNTIGFIPNGGRKYYLNRSQPPLFIQMLYRYVTVTNDTAILERALPLAEKEMIWWSNNRMINITSPWTNNTYKMARYDVNNTAPRPESYLTDYLTANGPDVNPPLNESQRAALYAELATGAESGWDYSTRWLGNGSADLKTLSIRSLIPVDLNSILYRDYIILSDLYALAGNSSGSSRQTANANVLRQGVLDLLWNSTKLAFYDFNITSNSQNRIFTAATFYPLWSGIIPDTLLSSAEHAFGFFSSINMVMNRYNGTVPVTYIESGLQWDAPNTWPPHQYIAIEALKMLPSNLTSSVLPTPASNQSTFNLIPLDQLGISENNLPGQPITTGQNATVSGPAADINKLNGTVVNGGNMTDGGWAISLQRQLANRYFTSALCSWRATGGSIDGLLPRLSDQELNVTQSVNNTGNMFEKFSILNIDSSGSGGEYTVQAGFGWTNGVLLWVAANFGDALNAPQCPNLLSSASASTNDTSSSSDGNNTTSSSGGDSGGSSGDVNSAIRLGLLQASSLIALLLGIMVDTCLYFIF